MLEIGSLVDNKYKILNEIGRGGMSIVYLAMVERANQTWAIKEVRKNGVTSNDVVEAGLLVEMNILKRLNHPKLPRIVDILDYEDSFLIVMDYIEGIDLDKKLRECPQDYNDVIDWGIQLCDVLNYLHTCNPPIIYRDMKPGNVKLKPDGNLVLFDFGTAREYKSQKAGDDTTCLGTRGYAAPEQYGGMGQTDARSDIYCLGATMFNLITGRLAGGPPDYSIPSIRAERPDLPRQGPEGDRVRGLDYIIQKCTQSNPANRYQNCMELMYDLQHPEKLVPSAVRKQRRQFKTWMLCGILTIVFALLSTGSFLLSNSFKKQQFTENITSAQEKYLSSDTAAAIKLIDSAIEIDPSDFTAWIYRIRLTLDDGIITTNEYQALDMLMSSDAGDELKADPQSYAKVCFEWGRDIYFFYDSVIAENGQGKDSEVKAAAYIYEVTNVDKSYLTFSTSDIRKQFDVTGIRLKKVETADAESEYSLCESLKDVCELASKLNKNSKGGLDDDNFSYQDYFVFLHNLAENCNELNSGALNEAQFRIAIYAKIYSTVSSNSDEFRYRVSDENIRNLYTMVLEKLDIARKNLAGEDSIKYDKDYEKIIGLYEDALATLNR